MPQQTAIEWLKEKVKETYDKEGKLPLGYILNLIAQAKAIEAEQIVKAHGDKYVEFDEVTGLYVGDIITGEQYYKDTYEK
jgi:hypothetical protein